MLASDEVGRNAAFAALVGTCAAAGLAAAHDSDIVHRDVKPHNILMNGFGQVKLCDFGIAALLKAPGPQTMTTSLSIQYASPEELDNDPDIGPPADIYSLGASLHHLLTGAPPSFKGGRGQDPDSTRISSRRDPVGARVGMVIEGCMQTDPSARPTAREVMDLLARVADTGPRAGPSQSGEQASATSGPAPSNSPAAAAKGDTPDTQQRGPRRTGRAAPDPVLPVSSDEAWWTR